VTVAKVETFSLTSPLRYHGCIAWFKRSTIENRESKMSFSEP